MNTQKGGAVLWVLVIIIITVGGFFFFTRSASDEGAATEEAVVEAVTPQESIVVYDASGFSPSVVTVKKGDTVIFQNKTGKPASVASGPHPTHTIYPEFDQYQTDQRGKTEFRFTFEKVGEWKYHDHLNASMTGTVVVTE